MNGNIKQFRQAVQSHLLDISTGLDRLHALTTEPNRIDEELFKNDPNRGYQTIENNRVKLEAVIGDMDLLFAKEKTTRDLVEGWKAQRQSSRLHSRADVCEECATAAIKFAALAIELAERITAQAVLARRDAVSVQVRELD